MVHVRPVAARGARGVSLIDLLVGITLLAVGVAGVASAFSYAAGNCRLSEEYITAEGRTSSLLAEARDQPLDSLTTWYTYAGEAGASGLEATFSHELASSGLKRAEAWFTVTDVQDDLKGLSITVTWGTGRPGGKVESETLVSPRY